MNGSGGLVALLLAQWDELRLMCNFRAVVFLLQDHLDCSDQGVTIGADQSRLISTDVERAVGWLWGHPELEQRSRGVWKSLTHLFMFSMFLFSHWSLPQWAVGCLPHVTQMFRQPSRLFLLSSSLTRKLNTPSISVTRVEADTWISEAAQCSEVMLQCGSESWGRGSYPPFSSVF